MKGVLQTVMIVLFGASLLFAQVGSDTNRWNWTPEAAHHESVVKVVAGGNYGTGVLVQIYENKPVKNGCEGLVLTAWHVVEDCIGTRDIAVTYRSGRRSIKCKVLEYNKEADVALLWVWAPKGILPASIATKPVAIGDTLEHVGLGGHSSITGRLRTFTGVAITIRPEQVTTNALLIPGDSGGPVFNANKEVVSIIAGGTVTFNSGIQTAFANIECHYPARSNGVVPIHALLAEHTQKQLVRVTDSDILVANLNTGVQK